MIHTNFAFLDRDMFKQLVVAMVRPHLEYGATVWTLTLRNK